MWKKIFKFLLILALLTGITSSSLAQRQTGAIKGKIIDKEGNPLPGAFIYVTSPALLGMRTYATPDTGTIRIPKLPPGEYKVIVEMPGFKTLNIENIIIKVGVTVTLNVTMELTAIEEEIRIDVPSQTPDVESTKIATVRDKALLRNTPLARNIHDIINSVAGITSKGFPYQPTSVVHGSTVRSNTYAFEGITMNDPAGMHLLTNMNFDVIDEVELETAAHPTEVALTEGGYINVVSKSGGNKFNGGINLYYTDDGLGSTLRSEEEMSALGVSPPSMDKDLWDLSLSLGGKFIEDMLWFFGNARLFSQSRTTPFIPWTDPMGNEHKKYDWSTDELMGFFKLSSQFIPPLKVTAMVSYVDRYKPVYESNLSWNLPEEATRIFGHEKNLIASGAVHYFIDQNTFVDLKGGYIYNHLPLKLNDKGKDNPQYFNEGTGHIWGSASWNETQIKKRFQAGVSLTHFKDSFFGGNHELKAGAEYEYAFGEWITWKEDNLLAHYYYSSPSYFGQDLSPVSGNPVDKGKISFFIMSKFEADVGPKSELRRLSFFAQDSATFADRVTLHAGLRFDRSTTRLYDLFKGESGNPVSVTVGGGLIEPLIGVNPYAQNGIQELKDMLAWNALSPRIGLSFDIFGNGKSIFKASFSRYREHLMLNYLLDLNPFNAYRSHQFYWFDENDDGEVDENDSFTLFPEDYRLYTEEYHKKRISPDIKSPYTDEFTVGLYKEMFKDFSLRINYIYKTKGNILENVLYDPDLEKDWYTVELDTEGWWIPFHTIVPSVDGYSDTPVTVYFRSNSAPDLFYRVKNVPELKRKYHAIEIAFKKRMSNNWQLDGSFVFSKATGNIGLSYSASQGFSKAADNPNDFVNLAEDSRLDLDRPLVVKLIGTYKFPFSLFFSFYYTYMKGTPWARSVTIIPPSSWAQNNNAYRDYVKVYLEKPGTRRTDLYNNLDLRIEKEFRLGRSGSFSFFVDIMNATGNKYRLISQNDGGFWFPEDEDTTQGIRDLSSYYKKIISLSGTRMFRLSLRLNF